MGFEISLLYDDIYGIHKSIYFYFIRNVISNNKVLIGNVGTEETVTKH